MTACAHTTADHDSKILCDYLCVLMQAAVLFVLKTGLQCSQCEANIVRVVCAVSLTLSSPYLCAIHPCASPCTGLDANGKQHSCLIHWRIQVAKCLQNGDVLLTFLHEYVRAACRF